MPSKLVHFLSIEEVLEIHNAMVGHFGGPPGIRDLGLLESALYRPQTGYYSDTNEMAAAMFESLIMNHPFVDGNKRVAFFTTDVFLRLNGYQFKVRPKNAHAFIVGLLESGKCDFNHLLPWIKKSIISLKSEN